MHALFFFTLPSSEISSDTTGIARVAEERIRSERKNGHTLQQIADKHSLPNSYVATPINRRLTFAGITPGTFGRMFPRAPVWLGGAPPGLTQASDNSAAATGDNSTVSAGGSDAAEALAAFRNRLGSAILDLDIPAEAARAVLKAIRDTK